MKNWLMACAMTFAFSTVALAEQGTVTLTDGSTVTGEILSYGQGADVVVQLSDGQVVTIPAANVAQVQVDESAFMTGQVDVQPQPGTAPPTYGQPQGQPQYQQPQQYQQPYQPAAQPVGRRPSLTGVFVLGGIGLGVGLVGGLVFSAYANSTCFDELSCDVNTVGKAVGGVLMGVGGALLILSLAVLLPKRLRARREWSQGGYALAPWIDRQAGGLALAGRF